MSHHHDSLETRVARLEGAVRTLAEIIRFQHVAWLPVCGWLPVRLDRHHHHEHRCGCP